MIKSVIYGPNDRCIYKILRKHHTSFHFDYTIVRPTMINILLSEHLLFFIVLGILSEVRQNVKQLWFVFYW